MVGAWYPPQTGGGGGGWTASSWISIPPIMPAAKLQSTHAMAVKIPAEEPIEDRKQQPHE